MPRDMFALPPSISRRPEVTGLGCPECPGSLTVWQEGDQGYLRFECRIEHTFSTDDVLAGKERRAEDHLWAAVLAFEEIAALLGDLERHAARHGGVINEPAYAERRAAARKLAAGLRDLISHDRPISLDVPVRVHQED
jgi:two-component system, chemotaxis family, protein-glutamate methylesterase/glutaminase